MADINTLKRLFPSLYKMKSKAVVNRYEKEQKQTMERYKKLTQDETSKKSLDKKFKELDKKFKESVESYQPPTKTISDGNYPKRTQAAYQDFVTSNAEAAGNEYKKQIEKAKQVNAKYESSKEESSPKEEK